MNVSSGPGTERLVRNGILAAMFFFMGLWFAYDGWIGYAQKNFDEYVSIQFDPDVRNEAAAGVVYPQVNMEMMETVDANLRGKTLDEQRSFLAKAFGGQPSFETEESLFYFGPALYLEFEKSRTRLTPVESKAGNHTETSILWQKIFGVIITGVGLGILGFVFYAAKSHAEVSDAGLSIRHRAPIAYKNMKALRDEHFLKKGLIDIDYEQDGANQTVRLDEYHYNKQKFGEIVACICQHTGFNDPVQAEKDAKRAAAANSTSA